ncbi:uncharacterized protein METZ01_LOCUS78426 [marine metagenome]|jgi:hypothetical protein|uniref:Uncharacterized protein n=1 Tax=marine metagenome TaxID=408172 RepID=A0A381UBF2_9ZZZZ
MVIESAPNFLASKAAFKGLGYFSPLAFLIVAT